MEAPELTIQKKAESIFCLLTQKCTFGTKITFWSFWTFWALLHFYSKLSQMSSREPMKHRPGTFWPKSWTSHAKVLQNAKMVKMVPFSFWHPKPVLSLSGPRGGFLTKRRINLVVYWDFWEPKSQMPPFVPFVQDFTSLTNWLSKLQNLHVDLKMVDS